MSKTHFTARTLFAFFLLVRCFSFSFSQVGDSLVPIHLLGRDALVNFQPEREEIVYGANRIAESTEELAVRTVVITREEIMRNGYTTLCDVLRNQPGFRTSEPGHSLVGEAFLMRGLEGNLYTKVLINGVPLLPSGSPGLPLGANLPIKQAERIEIIYGPATTVYGTDAVAGVINIVLPETEKPLEAMSNVAVANGGTDEFHLSIGGKAGGKRNTFTYRIFGSTRRMLDRPMHFRPTLFLLDTTIAEVRNIPRDGNNPIFTDLRHESRVIGLQAGFKGFSVMAMRMYRRDHSVIGNHPQEVAAFSSSSFVGESITNLQLQYDKTVKKLWMHTNLSGVFYAMDDFSSFQGVTHPLANGNNFMYAQSNDFQAEQLFNLKLNRFSLLLGGNYMLQTGTGLQNFLLNPFNEDNLITGLNDTLILLQNNTNNGNNLIGEFSPYEKYVRNNLGVFTQALYKTRSLSLAAGVRMDKAGVNPVQWSPKVSANWRVTDKFRLRAMACRAFRVPGAYYEFSNYIFSILPGEAEPSFKKMKPGFEPESFFDLEGGFTWLPLTGLKVEGHFTHTEMRNRIFAFEEFVVDTIPLMDQLDQFLGYGNLRSLAVYNSAEVFVDYRNDWLRIGGSAQYNFGFESLTGLDTLERLRSVPNLMYIAYAQLYLPKLFRAGVTVRYVGDFITWASIRGPEIVSRSTEGFYAMDAMIGRPITRRLDFYVRVKNVTNSFGSGITSTFISKTRARYVAQEGRMFYFGITFNLN